MGGLEKAQGPTTETLAGCRGVASLTPQPRGRLDKIGGSEAHQKRRGTNPRGGEQPLSRGEEGRERGGPGSTQTQQRGRLSEVGPCLKPPPLGANMHSGLRPIPSCHSTYHMHTYLHAYALLSKGGAAIEGVCCRGKSRGCSFPHQDALEWHCTKPLPYGALPRVGW